MENLRRICAWYNPLQAITEKGEAFELDNIIIYSENGVLIETDKGWFAYSNNDIDGMEIKPAIKRKTKVDFTKKENFVCKSIQKEYRCDCRYTLYLYYKNINYKYEGLNLDSLFLNLKYSILDNYKSYIVIGDTNKKSQSIEFCDELKEAQKAITHYNFCYHPELLEKAIKLIRKKQKEFLKAKEYEKTLTIDNWEELIRDRDREKLKNNKLIEEV